MKNSAIYCSIIFLIFSISSCKKNLESLTQFNIESEESFKIKGATGIATPLDVPIPDIETSIQSGFNKNNTNTDKIEKIKLNSIALEIASPDDGDFDFIEKIEIFIIADGLADKKIAWKDPVPSSPGNKIDLDVSEDNLKEYLVKSDVSYKVKVTMSSIVTEDHEIKVKTSFHVDALILGI